MFLWCVVLQDHMFLSSSVCFRLIDLLIWRFPVRCHKMTKYSRCFPLVYCLTIRDRQWRKTRLVDTDDSVECGVLLRNLLLFVINLHSILNTHKTLSYRGFPWCVLQDKQLCSYHSSSGVCWGTTRLVHTWALLWLFSGCCWCEWLIVYTLLVHYRTMRSFQGKFVEWHIMTRPVQTGGPQEWKRLGLFV